MHQRRPNLGRPEGTDGSDYSFRMTVDPRYTKVAEGKACLKLVIFLQVRVVETTSSHVRAAIQLLGVLYVIVFPPKEGVFNVLTIAAVFSGVVLYSMGEIGRRRSKVNLLKVYTGLSVVATFFAVGVTAKHSLDLRRNHNGSSIPNSCGWMVMEPADMFSYAHILLGALVEVFQVHTTLNLIKNMAPPRRE